MSRFHAGEIRRALIIEDERGLLQPDISQLREEG
jgi:hypothetical protein